MPCRPKFWIRSRSANTLCNMLRLSAEIWPYMNNLESSQSIKRSIIDAMLARATIKWWWELSLRIASGGSSMKKRSLKRSTSSGPSSVSCPSWIAWTVSSWIQKTRNSSNLWRQPPQPCLIIVQQWLQMALNSKSEKFHQPSRNHRTRHWQASRVLLWPARLLSIFRQPRSRTMPRKQRWP